MSNATENSNRKGFGFVICILLIHWWKERSLSKTRLSIKIRFSIIKRLSRWWGSRPFFKRIFSPKSKARVRAVDTEPVRMQEWYRYLPSFWGGPWGPLGSWWTSVFPHCVRYTWNSRSVNLSPTTLCGGHHQEMGVLRQKTEVQRHSKSCSKSLSK